MIQFGIISEMSSSKGAARVQLLEDDSVTDFLQIIYNKTGADKFFHSLDVGDQVACVVDSSREYGVIMGAIYSDEDTTDETFEDGVFKVLFSDGTYISYDKNTGVYTINSDGDVDVVAGGDVNVSADGKIIFNGGLLGTVPVAEDVKDRLNNIELEINDLKNLMGTWTPATNDGGAALKTILTGWINTWISETQLSDINNPDIEQ